MSAPFLSLNTAEAADTLSELQRGLDNLKAGSATRIFELKAKMATGVLSDAEENELDFGHNWCDEELLVEELKELSEQGGVDWVDVLEFTDEKRWNRVLDAGRLRETAGKRLKS